MGVGGIGGMAACEGAILLQFGHSARVAWMSAVMPGQNMDDSAFAIMCDVPWWAACRADRHVCRSAFGIISLSL